VLGDELHVVVRGMDGYSLWHSFVNLDTSVFSAWQRIGGATESNPMLVCVGSSLELYLVVRGLDDCIYINVWNGVDWQGWIALSSGATCDGAAATLLRGQLHVVVRGLDGITLWHGYLSDPTDPSSFSGWSWLSGSTDSEPILTS